MRIQQNLLSAASVLVLGFNTTVFAEGSTRKYEVSIQNLPQKQILTPPVLATSRGLISIYNVGSPASRGLRELAEDGHTSSLATLLPLQYDGVVTTVGNGPILPGTTTKYVVEAPAAHDHLSLVSMLAISNDAFAGLSNAVLPKSGSYTFKATVLDAGTEANTQSCSFIPGPPCGAHDVRDAGSSEGVVSVHRGITVRGDLDESYSWTKGSVTVLIKAIQ